MKVKGQVIWWSYSVACILSIETELLRLISGWGKDQEQVLLAKDERASSVASMQIKQRAAEACPRLPMAKLWTGRLSWVTSMPHGWEAVYTITKKFQMWVIEDVKTCQKGSGWGRRKEKACLKLKSCGERKWSRTLIHSEMMISVQNQSAIIIIIIISE